MLHAVTAGDVVGAFVGESERRLREVFERARADADSGHTVVVFLDEVRGGSGGKVQDGIGTNVNSPLPRLLQADALCPRRDGTRPHEARVVAQLLTLLDGADARPRQQQGSGEARGVGGSRGHLVVVAGVWVAHLI